MAITFCTAWNVLGSLKGQCNENTDVSGQFCAEVITYYLYPNIIMLLYKVIHKCYQGALTIMILGVTSRE